MLENRLFSSYLTAASILSVEHYSAHVQMQDNFNHGMCIASAHRLGFCRDIDIEQVTLDLHMHIDFETLRRVSAQALAAHAAQIVFTP